MPKIQKKRSIWSNGSAYRQEPEKTIAFSFSLHYNERKKGRLLMFKDKVVVITGGAGGIGKCIREEFEKQGAFVWVIDVAEGA